MAPLPNYTTHYNMQEAYTKIKKAAQPMGLTINRKKTKFMEVSNHKTKEKHIITDNKNTEKVNEFQYDLKVCDDGTLVQILCFWISSIILVLSKTPSCLYFKTQHFRDWIRSPSSGKTYSVGPNQEALALSIGLISNS
jgi:hypothetical protein